MNHIDLKYTSMLSGHLEGYKMVHQNPLKINFRCPLCGDSQTNRSKQRGWIIEGDNQFAFFHCFNCGVSYSLAKFIEEINPTLHAEYVRERSVEKYRENAPIPKLENRPVSTSESIPQRKMRLKKISQLPADHPVKKYIISRKIPSSTHYRMFFAPKFVQWINQIVSEDQKLKMSEHQRIVFPLIDKDGKVGGVNARALDDNSLRYIVIKFRSDAPKVFGLEQVDFTQKYYVVEGPIDSLFLPNSIAVAGTNFDQSVLENRENAMIVVDNQPRNKEVVRQTRQLIDQGFNCCIWPEGIDGKDINQLVIDGMSVDQVKQMIDQNTYKGLLAQLHFNRWRKIEI